ncbi:MAG: radical SAM protein [Polyangiaceae bacterium]|nr:radical SAM protein [Polyangiaceae bacterium]MBK8938575.1 radical SAM protein [Polyangiaceae bacterium]
MFCKLLGSRPNVTRSLPIAASRPHGRRGLPLLPSARAEDLEPLPRYVVWEITLKCDLACKHCGSRAGKGRPDELSTEEALDLVDQMASLGVEEVSLIGGEAYLRDDWDSIARRVRERGMVCGIVTGGKGFTAEHARRAKEAGVNGVAVSIDGLEATHDELRGRRGSFQAAVRTLELLREVGIPRAANTQINALSKDEIEAVFEVVAAREIYGWQVQFTVAMGRAADYDDLLLQPHELVHVMPRLARLKARCDAAGIRLEPGNNVGYFGPFERTFRGKYRRGHHEPCTAGTTTMGIEADGTIKGCPSLPSEDYVGGSVRDHSLADIWRRAPAMQFTRGRTREDLWGHCRSCYYADDCLAGCTWTSHVLFGKRGNNPYCHHRALELLEAGRRERVVRVEAPPGAPFDYGRYEIVEEAWPEAELARARAAAADLEGA